MAGVATDRSSPRSPEELVGELLAQWCGPHVLIRHRDEIAREPELLTTLPATPGSLVVLASAGAHQHPMLQMAIARFLSSLRSAGVNGTLPRPQAVWLAVANLRNAGGPNVGWLRRFSGELRIDMLAPDGKLTGAPGAGLYVGPSIGANGVFGGQPGYGVPV